MTDEELDRIWANFKAREERELADWNALLEENKRIHEMYDTAFFTSAKQASDVLLEAKLCWCKCKNRIGCTS